MSRMPSPSERGLEAIGQRLERVVGGESVDSLCGIDERWDEWRGLEVRDASEEW
jgi:hypothetical protein